MNSFLVQMLRATQFEVGKACQVHHCQRIMIVLKTDALSVFRV